MTNYHLPYFEQLPADGLDEYYEAMAVLNGHEIVLDLHLDSRKLSPSGFEKTKHLLEHLADIDSQNKAYIRQDYEDETEGHTVREYLQHHLEDIPQEELAKLIDLDNHNTSPLVQLLDKLKLVRLGLYPDSDEFAICDYSKDITNYLIVVYIDQNSNISQLTIES
jgi:hypothetical protein